MTTFRQRARTAFHQAAIGSLNRWAAARRTSYATFAMLGFHDAWRERATDETRFLAFCAAMRHLAHGQILQDLWVLFETDLKPGGYFVEFGAYDAEYHSNTQLLERNFGWDGLLVEPNPALLDKLRAMRSATVDQRCVWDVTGDTVELTVTADAELSSVLDEASADLHTDNRHLSAVETVPVTTVSLTDLLAEHHVPADFDFLSVDTEGTELRILRAFDFKAHRPRLVTVEHNRRPGAEAELDALMAGHGYERRFANLSDWDAWYRLPRPAHGPSTPVSTRPRP